MKNDIVHYSQTDIQGMIRDTGVFNIAFFSTQKQNLIL